MCSGAQYISTVLSALGELALVVPSRRGFVPAAQNLGVGLRWPCRGQMCAGVQGAMSRNALVRHVAEGFSRTGLLFVEEVYFS